LIRECALGFGPLIHPLSVTIDGSNATYMKLCQRQVTTSRTLRLTAVIFIVKVKKKRTEITISELRRRLTPVEISKIKRYSE